MVVLSSSVGPSFLFSKVVTVLLSRIGKSSVPKETLGLDEQAGEPQGGVLILEAIGERA